MPCMVVKTDVLVILMEGPRPSFLTEEGVTMQIKTMDDLLKAFRKDLASGEVSITDSLRDASGASLSEVSRKGLEDGAQALAEYLREWIQKLYDSYSPTEYFENKRTGLLKASVKTVVEVDNGELVGKVYFDDALAWRDSFMDKQPRGYLPRLLNTGWKVRANVSFKDKYHMGHYNGYGFMQGAIEDAMSDPRLDGIQIEFKDPFD